MSFAMLPSRSCQHVHIRHSQRLSRGLRAFSASCRQQSSRASSSSASNSTASIASRRNVLGMGVALGSWLVSQPSPALQGPVGGVRMMPDGFDLLQPNQKTLAEAAAPSFGFVDADKDGIVSLEELREKLPEIRSIPDDDILNYLHRLYDLNVDGKVSTEEFLTSTSIEACVSEDEVSQALFQVFDKDNNQLVSLQEFHEALGSINGDAGRRIAKRVFDKTDATGDGNGKLDEIEFVKAMNMMRMLFTD